MAMEAVNVGACVCVADSMYGMNRTENEEKQREQHEQNTLPHIIRFSLFVLSQIAFQPYSFEMYAHNLEATAK